MSTLQKTICEIFLLLNIDFYFGISSFFFVNITINHFRLQSVGDEIDENKYSTCRLLLQVSRR